MKNDDIEMNLEEKISEGSFQCLFLFSVKKEI